MSKRVLKGEVASDKMSKTVVVAVTTLKTHPKYLKKIRITKRYKAHSEGFDLKTGDKVLIEESRPLSKDKRWVVVSKE